MKKVIDELVKYLNRITHDKENGKRYRKYLEGLSKKDFERWLDGIESGDTHLSIIVPHDGPAYLDPEDNMAILKDLGRDTYEFILETDSEGVQEQSVVKRQVLKVPIRRPSQIIESKSQVSANDGKISQSTGQLTSFEKGSSISLPETAVLSGLGLDQAATELAQTRGGDIGMYGALKASLDQTGTANADRLEPFKTGSRANNVQEKLLLGMHIEEEK